MAKPCTTSHCQQLSTKCRFVVRFSVGTSFATAAVEERRSRLYSRAGRHRHPPSSTRNPPQMFQRFLWRKTLHGQHTSYKLSRKGRFLRRFSAAELRLHQQPVLPNPAQRFLRENKAGIVNHFQFLNCWVLLLPGCAAHNLIEQTLVSSKILKEKH